MGHTLLVCLLLLLTFIISTYSSHGLTCMPCNIEKCRSVQELKCKGGIVQGVCGCCKRCAKQKGDRCEGFWNIYGLCDENLRCEKRSSDRHAPGKCVKTKIGGKKS
ncbi:Uncharacterised protein g1935 [Pycnogonum litorale]